MKSEKEFIDKVEPIRKRVQERWDHKYPGLEFYIIWHKKNQTVYMRWQLKGGHIGENFSKYLEVSPEEIQSTVYDVLIFKIEELEAIFEKWAISKALDNRIYLDNFYNEREKQMDDFMKDRT